MDSRYDHLQHEPAVAQRWEAAEIGNPDRAHSTAVPDGSNATTAQQTPFSIIMPPPNANDPLHVGHAMFIALEDTLIRFHRMRGDDTVWIPGTDHAGIETQFVFEKKLQKQGKSRFDFNRQDLYAAIAQYVDENSGVAVEQMKKLGASADWSRFRFTLNDDIKAKVLATFAKLHQDKLIYRDKQLVNYCTHCGTSYSELEVNYVDRVDTLFYVKYPLKDRPGEFVEVATVRPEPIFVDTHLAVNPTDSKHRDLIGQIVLNPLTGAEMPIIGDEFVDPAFGTGIVKLTPAHDPNDFAVAKKHNLPIETAIGFDGKIVASGGELAGLKVAAAREKAVEILRLKGLLDEDRTDLKYAHRVGTCYRCGRVIEPLLRAQFFLKVQPLTQRVLHGMDEGDFTVLGAGYDKILRHWLINLRDWNLSRQIVWGITIPVWYPTEGNEDHIIVSFIDAAGTYTSGTLASQLAVGHTLTDIKAGLQQVYADESVEFEVSEPVDTTKYLPETDTFDTWFSSGQWPVVTLQTTRDNNADFTRFYPTSVMETGYDILPFWVMRMLLLGYYITDRTPFTHVYLHGLVRDAKGQKMSKSKGNVVNPLEVIEKYGADALRLALIIRSTPGLDKSVSEGDFKAMRNFTNKVWNAARYVQQLEVSQSTGEPDSTFTAKLDETARILDQELRDLKIGLAAETAYNEFWHWFCDEAIEQTKAGTLSPALLRHGLETWLKLLHPFVPFVTEAVWHELHPDSTQPLALERYSSVA